MLTTATTPLVVRRFSLKIHSKGPLKRPTMDRPENAVVHPLWMGMGKRNASTHPGRGYVLSSGGDCTPLHGGTSTMPHPHPRNKAHQAVLLLAGFRTGIRVSQMDCHGKGVHGAGFRGRIAGPECIVEPSPKLRTRHIHAWLVSYIQHDDLASSVGLCSSIWPPATQRASLGVSRSLCATSRPATLYM